MHRLLALRSSLALTTSIFAGIALAGGCGSNAKGFDDGTGGVGSFGDDAARTGPCVNLQCQQVDCAVQGKSPTTVSGTVFDPAGKRPLYNAIVYVPNVHLDPFPSGVSCDQCGTVASGSPVVSALTGADGKFVLKNVPVGANIPLVVQVGKWRRQLTVPNVAACVDTPMNDPNVMRLPKNQSEGEIPQMAITTGTADVFECLLRKVGLDDAEFTSDQGSGRVHLYQGEGTSARPAPSATGSSPATTLWSDLGRMKRYDVIINACEGGVVPQPQASLQNFLDYVNAGGRTFNTHFNYNWISVGIPPLPSTANFVAPAPHNFPRPFAGIVDTSFPKGEAFAEWLVNVGASQSKGQLPLGQPKLDVTSVNPPSLRWLSWNDAQTGTPMLLHYTFATPVGAPQSQQCGKVLFSDFHVEDPTGPNVGPFPSECTTQDMTAADLALEFMLFDLSACIQPDTDPPAPPHIQ